MIVFVCLFNCWNEGDASATTAGVVDPSDVSSTSSPTTMHVYGTTSLGDSVTSTKETGTGGDAITTTADVDSGPVTTAAAGTGIHSSEE